MDQAAIGTVPAVEKQTAGFVDVRKGRQTLFRRIAFPSPEIGKRDVIRAYCTDVTHSDIEFRTAHKAHAWKKKVAERGDTLSEDMDCPATHHFRFPKDNIIFEG
jgi:hypothetical protein